MATSFVVSNIALYRKSVDAKSLDFAYRVFGSFLGAAIVDGDVATQFRQRKGGRPSDSPSSASDDSRFILNKHWCSFLKDRFNGKFLRR
jgi:hypothetical protein